MWVHLDPWGPFGPVPPNSRLSSLLWQSVQRIWVPMARPWVTAVQVQHVGQQAGLRERAAAGMHDGMAGGGRDGKLRDQVQRIARRNRAHREVSINRLHLLARAGAVAAQAVLILIDGGRKHGDSVGGADARDVLLRDADQRRRRKCRPTAWDPCALWQSTQVA